MTSFDFTGSSIVVLGGTGEIGCSIAENLASRAAFVTVAGRDATQAGDVARAIGGEHATFDFTDHTTLMDPIDRALSAYGSVDGIVNAAGVVAFGPLSTTPRRVLDEIMTVNLVGPLALYADAIRHMDSGFIANVTGIVATTPTAGMAAYSASKAGLSAATIALAREVRRNGITVIDARPPHTATGLATRAIAGVAPTLPDGLEPERVARRIVDGIASGRRILEPEWFTEHH